MNSPRKDHFVTTALAAFILGLVVCPYIYIAVGALRGFELVPLLSTVTPLLVGSAFLLWRYVSKPIDQPKSTIGVMDILLPIIELISWLVTVDFLYFISFFNLLRGLERIGVFILVFLFASILCLPVVLIRNTALKYRLMSLPMSLLLGALIVILALSGGFTIANIMTPSNFLGNPPSLNPG